MVCVPRTADRHSAVRIRERVGVLHGVEECVFRNDDQDQDEDEDACVDVR